MFLGNTDSPQENVHVVKDMLAGGNRRDLELYRYPGTKVVRHYFPMTQANYDPPDDAEPVFIGQVPNMMPLPHLAWALDAIAGTYCVECLKPTKKTGCAIAWVRKEHKSRILKKSRVALFDVLGFWYAKTEEQQKRLQEYCLDVRAGLYPAISEDGRVPKSCMVFEELGRPQQTTQAVPTLGHVQTKEKKYNTEAAKPINTPFGDVNASRHPGAAMNVEPAVHPIVSVSVAGPVIRGPPMSIGGGLSMGSAGPPSDFALAPGVRGPPAPVGAEKPSMNIWGTNEYPAGFGLGY